MDTRSSPWLMTLVDRLARSVPSAAVTAHATASASDPGVAVPAERGEDTTRSHARPSAAVRFGLLTIAIVLSGCGATVETTFTAIGEPEPNPEPSAAACDPAPAWLVDAILRGMTWDGATLSGVYVIPAGKVSGPAIVESDAFATAWLVAGTIGRQVQKAGVWITNSLDEGHPGPILAVNAAARRYSSWGTDLPEGITAEGFDHALACTQPDS